MSHGRGGRPSSFVTFRACAGAAVTHWTLFGGKRPRLGDGDLARDFAIQEEPGLVVICAEPRPPALVLALLVEAHLHGAVLERVRFPCRASCRPRTPPRRPRRQQTCTFPLPFILSSLYSPTKTAPLAYVYVPFPFFLPSLYSPTKTSPSAYVFVPLPCLRPSFESPS